MYRAAAMRLLRPAAFGGNGVPHQLSRPIPTAIHSSILSTNPKSRSFAIDNSPIHDPTPPLETPNYAGGTESSSSSSTSSSSSSSASYSSTTAEEARHNQRRKPIAVDYEEEQARVLQASLPYVMRLGWTEAAMIAGARDVGVSPSIVGAFPRKEAALVEFFMDDCLQKFIDRVDSEENLKSLITSQRISKLVRIRLEMQVPYIPKWPQALSIQAQPQNISTSFKHRAMLVDEIWHAAGDEAFDIDWYVKRTVLGGIYSTTEVYMLTDSSPDFLETWEFLDERVKNAFDLKKTMQEAKYLAEAMSVGMVNSLQGFVDRVFQR